MARPSKQKACKACTESKRRCDKTLPSCTRCDDRDIDCHYPPTKRRRHRLHEAAGIHDPSATASTSAAADLFSLDADPLLPVGLCNAPWIDFGPLPPDLPTNLASYVTPSASTSPEDTYRSQNSTNPPIDSRNKTTIDSLAQSKWFLAPSTWHIDRRPNPQRGTYPTSVLTNFTRGLQTWVKRWVLHGHNPFIHRSMYAEGNHFPSAIQDALTSASLYHHKTPDNQAFVHRILDERVTALMASQPVADETTLCVPLLETRDHLARVQALFVYTIIRLFDGSVTQRTAAEAHLPTLSLWCRQLWHSAVLDANTLSADLVPGSKYCSSSSGAQAKSHNDTYESDLAIWNLWVLSESVRRTWLLATCTIGVYATLKGNWSECPGGALFTTRAGLWDAPSAPRWAAMCRELASSEGEMDVYARLRPDERDAGSCGKTFFVPSFRSDGLFGNAAAAEVDECARHLFTVIWGLDRVESWALRTASAGEVCLTY